MKNWTAKDIVEAMQYVGIPKSEELEVLHEVSGALLKLEDGMRWLEDEDVKSGYSRDVLIELGLPAYIGPDTCRIYADLEEASEDAQEEFLEFVRSCIKTDDLDLAEDWWGSREKYGWHNVDAALSLEELLDTELLTDDEREEVEEYLKERR